jgi:hypothetical protein
MAHCTLTAGDVLWIAPTPSAGYEYGNLYTDMILHVELIK